MFLPRMSQSCEVQMQSRLEGVEKNHGAIFRAIKSRRDAGTRRAAISSRRDVWRASRRETARNGASRREMARRAARRAMLVEPLSQY